MSSKLHFDNDDKKHLKHDPSTTEQSYLNNQPLPHILQRAKLNPAHLTPSDVMHLQRTVGNHAVSQLLANNIAQRLAIPALPFRLPVIQRTYADVEKKAKKNQAIDDQDLEDAIKEFLVELVEDQGYQDSGGNPVGKNEMQGVGFIWGADYGAVQGTVLLPSKASVITDIKDGTFKMALRHEMGHYIRQIATQTGTDTFQDVEDVISDIDWDDLATQYPQGDMNNWKEEVRADLKGVRLQYREKKRFPNKSELAAFQAMLGGVVDNAHPPAAFRVETMKTYIKSTSPAKCCYLTTACVEARGLPDDCEELTLLRHFRDTYLLKQPHGEELIDLYYDYSPAIVKKIDEDEEREAIYAYIYAVVRDCVDAIKRAQMDYTYRVYCDMVVKLQDAFIPDEPMPAYQL